MAFDSDTRSKLARMVTLARQLLTDEFTQQLQEIYGIQPDGAIVDVDKLTHLDDEEAGTAKFLRERIDHLVSGMTTEKKPVVTAIYRAVREQAFTMLNRFAALRMCEERGLVEECVRAGMQSKGFKVYENIAGSGVGEIYGRYKTFLFCLFDEIAVELGVLFDRFSPQGLLFPREQALLELLTIINNNELSKLWAEDETIGWIYQHFNPPEERKAMREASQAPRSSRELAVRNQFFTPRFVVEFLTDNTLGQIWYEMHKGDTILKEKCRYLVRRPKEIFLQSGEKPPTEPESETALSQEELLKKTTYIDNRPKKDPREIKVLDPACGSGHFLLYAFDVLERIYEEAWADYESPKSEITGQILREDFKTLEELRRAVPKMIIEHNLHGIDIDPRAVQIATLALWLRAQMAWKNIGVKVIDRPRLQRSNIVTAEPMPGEDDMRREFIACLKPKVLSQLVDVVFDKMKLAGEAGSLLKIEEEIRHSVSEAKKQWLEGPKIEQAVLFPEIIKPKPVQQKFRFDLTGITDAKFWEQAEDCMLYALKDYAEQAEYGNTIRRRLFAEDAARGFAFINLCRNRYDVVLMNPPFGLSPKNAFEYARTAYPNSYTELLATFVERGSEFSSSRLGAITSRAFMVATRLANWRRDIVVGKICFLVDLGENVMDAAFVEAAAYVLDKAGRQSLVAFDFRKKSQGGENLLEEFNFSDTSNVYVNDSSSFLSFPKNRIAYSVNSRISGLLRSKHKFEPIAGTARQGLATWDDFRFLRVFWEVPPSEIGVTRTWEYLAKGGSFSRFLCNVHLLMKWKNEGLESRAINIAKNDSDAQARQASEYWRRPGLTYSIRSQRGFSVRVLPKGCLFTGQGPLIVSTSQISNDYILGWINSSLIRTIVEIQSNDGKFMSGLIKTIPWREPKNRNRGQLEQNTRFLCSAMVENDSRTNICSPYFCTTYTGGSIAEICRTIGNHENKIRTMLLRLDESWNEYVFELYGVGPDTIQAMRDQTGFCDEDFLDDSDNYSDVRMIHVRSTCINLLDYFLGLVFGRWDVRIALNQSLAPKLPDPFDPLPTCPPGMLIGSDGLPAESSNIASEEWLHTRPDANTLPPDDSVKKPIIPDSDYPLKINWDGIMVDDPKHKEDIIHYIREVLDLLWKDKATEIEQESCDILGISELRDYFSKPSGFFQDHLKCYSKSRRKAPIYWPLSTKSGSYTLWIYYHRLTDQTLYACVNDYVNPKLDNISKDIVRLQEEVIKQESTKSRQRLEQLMDLELELRDFRAEMLRVAGLPYKPNLNDGVMITAAPLLKLFCHHQWRKDLETCWIKLKEGNYDWAHLAYAIWPERVKEKCKKDLSIAIAHDLEDLYKGDNMKLKRLRGKANI